MTWPMSLVKPSRNLEFEHRYYSSKAKLNKINCWVCLNFEYQEIKQMKKPPENTCKGMNPYGPLNYHQSFPNLAWPNNAIWCDAIVWLPCNKYGTLLVLDDYTECDQVSNLFIFIWARMQAEPFQVQESRRLEITNTHTRRTTRWF